MAELVNDYRNKADVSALTQNSDLTDIAYDHALALRLSQTDFVYTN